MNRHLYNDPTTKPDRRRLRKDSTDAARKLWNILRSRHMADLRFFRQYSVAHIPLIFIAPNEDWQLKLMEGNTEMHVGNNMMSGAVTILRN